MKTISDDYKLELVGLRDVRWCPISVKGTKAGQRSEEGGGSTVKVPYG